MAAAIAQSPVCPAYVALTVVGEGRTASWAQKVEGERRHGRHSLRRQERIAHFDNLCRVITGGNGDVYLRRPGDEAVGHAAWLAFVSVWGDP